MHHVRSIILYLEKGYSVRAICRELPLSRPTIAAYALRLQSHTASLKELQNMSDADLAAIVYREAQPATDVRKSIFTRQVPYFLNELKRTGVTRLLLWQEYCRQYPEGYGYTQFCVSLARYRNVVQPSMHIDHQPARGVMIDFAGDTMSYVDSVTGEVTACPVLVCVLPYSGYSFARALPCTVLAQLIAALNECLSFFGGVPHSLKTDNMRQLVTKPSRYEPAFTEAITQWAQHYNIALTATSPRI